MRRRYLEQIMPALYGYAVSLTGDRVYAEDLVQETAIRLLSAKRTPDDFSGFRAFSFRVLRNYFIDQLRAHKREVLSAFEESDLPVQEAMTTGWRLDERIINRVTVAQALDSISPAHKDIILLVDINGFSYQEAAAILEVAIGTVMSRLSRARAAMLQAMTENNVRLFPRQTLRKHPALTRNKS